MCFLLRFLVDNGEERVYFITYRPCSYKLMEYSDSNTYNIILDHGYLREKNKLAFVRRSLGESLYLVSQQIDLAPIIGP